MTFLHPEFLYYMLPIVVILFGLLLTQKEPEANFFAAEVIKKLQVTSNSLTLRVRNSLFFLISILLIVALSAPVIKDGKVEVQQKSADIMIALDISDSMLATDVYPNRLELAKQKALEFLRLAPNERIGVIAFAKNSYLVSPLSFDHDAVRFLLSKLDTTSITEQGTNLMSMLHVMNKSVKEDAKKYILLFSDGGDSKDYSKEIAYAKAHGIVVFVLGMGTKQGAPIKMKNGEFIKQNGKIILSKLNENIANLAIKTGGVYIENVNSDKDVKAMLKEIESSVKKKERKSQEIENYIQLFYYPLGLALLFLLIALSSFPKIAKKEIISAFVLALFFVHPSNAKAGLLDFMDLKDAKEAYAHKDFAKSAKYYDTYAKSANNDAGYYNAGNSLYKEGKYKEALKNYEKATFADRSSRADNFANMGNCYAKMGSDKDLKEAIDAYEKSLKLKEDKATRENLEAVKKALKKRKEQQKKKQQQKKKNQKKQQQKNKNQKKQDKGKNQKSKDKKENKNSKDSQKNKGKGNKEKQSEKKSDRKSKKPAQERSQKEKKEQKKKEQKAKQQKAKELKKEQKEKLKESQSANLHTVKNRMSDAEEKKWLKALNKEQNSFLYRLNKNNKYNKDNTDEKPW